jgi:hypothetical protein
MSLNGQLLVLVVFGLCIEICINIYNAHVAKQTHQIVNSQRSTMLRIIASLSRRIANENPKDERAQSDARSAELDSKKSSDRNERAL